MTWTILTESGGKAIDFTSMFTLEVRDDGEAVSTPVEKGSFASYNKVQNPTRYARRWAFRVTCSLWIMSSKP